MKSRKTTRFRDSDIGLVPKSTPLARPRKKVRNQRYLDQPDSERFMEQARVEFTRCEQLEILKIL